MAALQSYFFGTKGSCKTGWSQIEETLGELKTITHQMPRRNNWLTSIASSPTSGLASASLLMISETRSRQEYSKWMNRLFEKKCVRVQWKLNLSFLLLRCLTGSVVCNPFLWSFCEDIYRKREQRKRRRQRELTCRERSASKSTVLRLTSDRLWLSRNLVELLLSCVSFQSLVRVSEWRSIWSSMVNMSTFLSATCHVLSLPQQRYESPFQGFAIFCVNERFDLHCWTTLSW